MLDCSVCSITSTGDNGFCCPACARAALYQLRVEHVKILVAKEALRRQVDAVAVGVNAHSDRVAESTSVVLQEGSKQFQHNQTLADTAESHARCHQISQHSHMLKEQIRLYKTKVDERQRALAIRRSDLATAAAALACEKSSAVAPLKKAIRKLNHRHGTLYNNLMSARVYLCLEAATLMGLQRKDGVAEDGKVKEEYSLGGGKLMDLRDLNEYTNTEISVALDNIAHLLFLSCYYLGIRMPAELAIPGETHPSPAIYQPFSSYLFYNHKEGFSIPCGVIGMFGAQHIQNDHGESPRARPLVIDRKLVLLAREDPTQFSLCIEGMSLMAWNVAWLCRTQGINVADEDWEEVCAVGRNLWLLLVSASKISQREEAISLAIVHKAVKKPVVSPIPLNDDHRQMSGRSHTAHKLHHGPQQDLKITLGRLSHATAHGFLAPSFGTSPMPANSASSVWRFASPVRVIDKLKSLLFTEMSGLEWELLEEDDFGEPAEPAPLLREQCMDYQGLTVGNTHMHWVGSEGLTGGEAKRGTSGWTKVKSRAKS